MPETPSYWVCGCGRSNFQNVKNCTDCSKPKPTRIKYYIGGAIFVFLLLLFGEGNVDPTAEKAISVAQVEFLKEIDRSRGEINSAKNDLDVSIKLKYRDKILSSNSKIVNWSGKIVQIQQMRGKAAVSINLGGVIIYAGVHDALGIDTLISPKDFKLFDSIQSMKIGEDVLVSGAFAVNEGSLVELSYSSASAIAEPSYLFEFDEINLAKVEAGSD